jgi:hypothetical protein
MPDIHLNISATHFNPCLGFHSDKSGTHLHREDILDLNIVPISIKDMKKTKKQT